MRVAQINAVCETGSTGRICRDISRYLSENGVANTVLYSMGNSRCPDSEKISSDGYIRRQALRSRVLGNYGFNSARATARMIERLKHFSPDIVHLHNIHGHDCHLERLFRYLIQADTKVIWTFHDCWAFTAYCPHYVLSHCDQWQTTCAKCPQIKKYSLFRDGARRQFVRKKQLLESADFTIVTPSRWLKGQVAQSFLKNHAVEVIPNGIDLSVFRPVQSDVFRQYGITGEKKRILGVAYQWNKAKGLDVFIKLAERLDPSRYQIILLGTDKALDAQLPQNILSVHRTANTAELVGFYSGCDVFVNPTRGDTFPSVNMEALACGLPVVTFNTGGSPEIISPESGIVVAQEDINGLLQAVTDVCEAGVIQREQCVKRAEQFALEHQLKHYFRLYQSVVSE